MISLDLQIEELKNEMYKLIDENANRTAEEVVKKSQELDKLIVLEQQEELFNGKVLL